MKYNIGYKIGNLTITDYNKKKCYYEFTCNCGKTFIGTTQTIKQKEKQYSIINFTGCKICVNKVLRDKISDAEHYLPIFKQYRRDALKRKKDFDLTLNDCVKLFKDSCFYCGDSFSNSITIGKRLITYNGIDRLDNSRGYNSNNVVACCGNCNLMKRTQSYSDFINRINKIYMNVQRPVERRRPKWAEMESFLSLGR